MKFLLIGFFTICTVSAFGQPEDTYNDLLSEYVSEEGKVDYKGFIDNKEGLQTYLDYLSGNRPSDDSPENERLAYWINAYNAFTIKLIIDNYPLESIKDLNPWYSIPGVFSVWNINFFEIEGEECDLNTIEHGILRKEFDEARIHFAINCASISCPNLRNEVYRPEILEEQLNDQTSKFLTDEGKNKISENNLELSKIFSWFGSDFGGRDGILDFVNKFSDIEISKQAKITYLPYDWSLNE